jgi:hypothetical protein
MAGNNAFHYEQAIDGATSGLLKDNGRSAEQAQYHERRVLLHH